MSRNSVYRKFRRQYIVAQSEPHSSVQVQDKKASRSLWLAPTSSAPSEDCLHFLCMEWLVRKAHGVVLTVIYILACAKI